MKKRVIQGKKAPINLKLSQKIEALVENKLNDWKKKAASLHSKTISIQSESGSKEPIHFFNFGKSR